MQRNAIRRHGITLSAWAIVTVLFAACTRAADPIRPQRAVDLSVTQCLDALEQKTPRASARCPGFLFEAVTTAQDVCNEAGGELVALAEPNLWAIDVNGDGRQEFTFEQESNVACEGFPSIFSCGSLGCPTALYEQREATWRPIASISADSMQSLELLDTSAGEGYRDLRVGCLGETPCTEYSSYTWQGTYYDATRLEARGFGVDIAGSVHGLYALLADTDVLAGPAPGAQVLRRYDAGTEVAIIGTAEGPDYYYVSPCNACESGFVRKAAVRVP